MNTQAQTHPIKNVDDPVQHIAEEMMVELQKTNLGIPFEIFLHGDIILIICKQGSHGSIDGLQIHVRSQYHVPT